MSSRIENSAYRFAVGDSISIDYISYSVVEVKEGGMGAVYFLDRTSPRTGIDRIHLPKLAAKGVRSDLLQDEDLNLFENELNIWIVLEHPHIIKMLKICHVRGVPLALMPVCEGSLRDILLRRKQLSVEEVLSITEQVSAALEYAYCSFGIVHLDVKPENVLQNFSGRRELKFAVTDWGIATFQKKVFDKITSSNGIDSTYQTFNNFGTLPYMSPERLLPGLSSSLISDVYSIGMMMHEMLCGVLPFDFLSGKKIAHQVLELDYFLIAQRQLSQWANDKLARFILQCIHPDPRERYTNYPEFRSDLKRLRNPLQRAFKYLF